MVLKSSTIGQNSGGPETGEKNNWETTSSVFLVDPTKPKYESLQSVRSTGHVTYGAETWTLPARLVHNFKIWKARSAKYGKTYAWGFSAGSNPKPGDPPEN
jgi:hypothetical protein